MKNTKEQFIEEFKKENLNTPKKSKSNKINIYIPTPDLSWFRNISLALLVLFLFVMGLGSISILLLGGTVSNLYSEQSPEKLKEAETFIDKLNLSEFSYIEYLSLFLENQKIIFIISLILFLIAVSCLVALIVNMRRKRKTNVN